ncbi:MAG: hypothetical protein H5T86_07395 [Armatimonadetes bacterium]|nr:hypothetical protein [Armatimonadota bacterium]
MSDGDTLRGNQRRTASSEWRLIIAPLLVLAALAISYSYIIPLGYGPDEPRHYNAIRLLWVEQRLPRVLPDGRELGNAMAQHPPTYYFVEGVFWYPAHGLGRAVARWARSGLLRRLVIGAEPAPVPDELLAEAVAYRIFRLTSLLWGMATIFLAFRAVQALWPEQPLLAGCVAWLMAMWPHALMNYATVTNDCGANFAGALFVWYWACRAPRGPGDLRHAAAAGLVLALAALMKIHVGATLAVVTVLALAWPHGRRCCLSAAFWARLAVAAGVVILLAGPWYARNFVLYGHINYVPEGYSIIPRGMTAVDAALTGILGQALLATLWGLFRSIWAQVGWFPQSVAQLVYGILLVFSVAALAGLRRFLLSCPSIAEWRRRAACLLLPFPIAVLIAIYIALFVHFGWHEGGRYLLFALPGLALCLAGGLTTLFGDKRAIYVVVVLLAALNLLSAFNLVTYLNPTYGTTVLIGQ